MKIAITSALHDALKTCSDIERQIVAIGKRVDPERKFELVQFRRKFAEIIGELSLLISSDSELAKCPEKLTELDRVFSSFRYAIGLHQASWPAVRIDEDAHAFSASARETYVKSDQFWDWCTQNLSFSRV